MTGNQLHHAANLGKLFDAAKDCKWITIARHALHARLSLPLTFICKNDAIELCAIPIEDHVNETAALLSGRDFTRVVSLYALSIEGKSGATRPAVLILTLTPADSCGAIVEVIVAGGAACAGRIRQVFETQAEIDGFIRQ